MKKKKKRLLIFLLLIILVVVGYYYKDTLFKEKSKIEETKEEKKEQEEKKEEKQESEPVKEEEKKEEINKNAYHTADGKYELVIVKSGDEKFNKAKDEYAKDNQNENPLAYAYLNNKVLALFIVQEDELYATYTGFFAKIKGQFQECFLVDVKKKQIIEKDVYDASNYNDDLGDDYHRFNGEARGYTHIKNSVGYFFQKVSEFGSITYTTDWKKLGYLDSVESGGINVCNDYIFCTVITKYDAKGNALEVNKNNDFVYKSKDSKYNLRIIHASEIKSEDKTQNTKEDDLYAYFNDKELITITSYLIDSKYILYKGSYVKKDNTEQFYLVNNETKELIVYPYFVKEDFMEDEGYYLFNEHYSPISYINTSIGYFFYLENNKGVKTVFTTKWKKLGYTKDFNISGKAIVLYDNIELIGTTKKFDNNGNLVN